MPDLSPDSSADLLDAEHFRRLCLLGESVRDNLRIADSLGVALVGIDLDQALCRIAALLRDHGPAHARLEPGMSTLATDHG